MAQCASQLCAAYWFTCDVAKVLEIGSRAIHLIEKHHLEKEFFGMGFSVYSQICSYYGDFVAWMGRVRKGSIF